MARTKAVRWLTAVTALVGAILAGYFAHRARDVKQTAFNLEAMSVVDTFASLSEPSVSGSTSDFSKEWEENTRHFWNLYNGRRTAARDAPIETLMIAEGSALRFLGQKQQPSCQVSPKFFDGMHLLFHHCAKRATECSWPIHLRGVSIAHPFGASVKVDFECDQSGFSQLQNIANMRGSCRIEVATSPQDVVCSSNTHHLEWSSSNRYRPDPALAVDDH
jgi:hypothetical protein